MVLVTGEEEDRRSGGSLVAQSVDEVLQRVAREVEIEQEDLRAHVVETVEQGRDAVDELHGTKPALPQCARHHVFEVALGAQDHDAGLLSQAALDEAGGLHHG